jgi:AraC-like DNA-binding protein
MRIVETRQRSTGGSRGILLPWDNDGLEVLRIEPSSDLAPFVERHWVLRWRLGGRSHLQRTMGFPCVDLVFEPGGARIHGPKTRVLEHRFEDSGRLFATKLRPGAWSSFSAVPVRQLVDRSIAMADVFGADVPSSLADIDDQACRQRIENMLRARSPRRDARADLAARIVERVLDDISLVRAEQVEDAFGMRERAVQRLFRQYVGVGLKWLIRWRRLQLAAERLRATRASADLAIELGYFDQAHLGRDFATFVGLSPNRYFALGR